MGFTIQYRTTRPIDDAQANAIRAAANGLNAGRTWLSCEPVHFYQGQQGGRLAGFSKPNFMPHPEDAAEAEALGLPDGKIRDAIDVLCELSRAHGVDWEFAHDYDPGPIGFIQNGIADARLLEQIDGIAGLTDMMDEGFGDDEDEYDEGDGPPILPFRPKN